MNMRNIILLSFFGLTFLQFGCSTNKLLLFEDNPKCQTTIEGNFRTPQTYKYFAPAILFKKDFKLKYDLGKVIRENEGGVYFEKKTYSFLDHPDTVFYNYSDIRAIVDSNYFCLYGHLEDNECKETSIKIYLEKEGSPEYQPIYLELVTNEKFSYCVDPGSYKVKRIVKHISEDYYYECFPVFDINIEALFGRANYIGDIVFSSENNQHTDFVKIPYYKQVKAENAGAAFGVIGSIIANSSNSSWRDKISGYYYFSISNSADYKSDSQSKINSCPLNIKIIH